MKHIIEEVNRNGDYIVEKCTCGYTFNYPKSSPDSKVTDMKNKYINDYEIESLRSTNLNIKHIDFEVFTADDGYGGTYSTITCCGKIYGEQFSTLRLEDYKYHLLSEYITKK